ncbi:MAG: hypothetical protein HQL87_10295 [Magnetococcales bacterium]|nr:hypothetical protein [Magnetococcales bacterium]
MKVKRKYSSDDILEWVEFLAKDPTQTPESLAGMRVLVDTLKHFEHITDDDMDAKVKLYFPTALRPR